MDAKKYIQEQVSPEDWGVLQELGVTLDARIAANLWPDFVNFEKRRITEVPFLIEQLRHYSSPRIFNSCLGSGASSIGLQLEGFNVVSNEIDKEFTRVGMEEAAKYGIDLTLTTHDWRELDGIYHSEFDAVLCLGNSLTHLFKKEDQQRTLRNFYHILKRGGKLIIDERNYTHHLLAGRYKYSGEVVYCGKDNVDAHPRFVSESMVVMEYVHKVTSEKCHLIIYPFKKHELLGLLEEAGFRNIAVFGDYNAEFDPQEPEFLTYVVER